MKLNRAVVFVIMAIAAALIATAPAHATRDAIHALEAIVTLDDALGEDKSLDITFTVADRQAGAAVPKAIPVDARLEPEVRGYAPAFNFAHHEGRITSQRLAADWITINLELTLAGDRETPGGDASFSITIGNANGATGTFEGKILDREVKGKASVRIRRSPVGVVEGHRPLKPGEHPRLVFRAADMPTLKERTTTPEGKAILAMLTRRSPLRWPRQVDDRRSSWMAANWGMIHQLTDDKEAAGKARRVLMDEVVQKPMPEDRADIHLATRLLGAALTYDLCHEAWDAEFRALVGAWLRREMNSLYDGRNLGLDITDFRPEPWTHRNAIRMSAIGITALALLHEKDIDGKPIEEAAKLARLAERDIVLYLQHGMTTAGQSLEGPFYKSFALSNGVLAFMHALRTAQGRDLSQVNAMLLSGYVVDAPAVPNPRGYYDFNISSISIQASGRWPIGLSSVPVAQRGAMKWALDRSVGLKGAGHFDCAWPFQAGYALASYPFDTQSDVTPAALPLILADPTSGSGMWRDRWRDRNDVIISSWMRGLPLKGLELSQSPPPGLMSIEASGRRWLDGIVGLKPRNNRTGGRATAVEAPREGLTLMTLSLDGLYYRDLWKPPRRLKRFQQPGPDVDPELAGKPGVRTFPLVQGAFRDEGIRLTRHMAVDTSGASGASVLVVIVDEMEKASDDWWLLPTPGVSVDRKTGRLSASTTKAGDGEDKAQSRVMTGMLWSPDKIDLRSHLTRDRQVAGLSARGGSRYIAVLALWPMGGGEGAPQGDVNVKGDANSARITIGARTFIHDRQGLRVEAR